MSDLPDPKVPAFIPEALTSNFEKCAADPNIPLYEFIQAFEHLVLLLNRLGTMFSFITVDILDKLKLIREKRLEEFSAKNGQIENYKNFTNVLNLEKSSIDKKKKPSRTNPPTATRQLQLLQRAMRMLYLFMLKIANNECNGKVSQMAWEAYSSSPLPNYHPWLVRNGVKVAVYTLPNRENFFKLTAPELTTDEIISHLGRASKAMDVIYEKLEAGFKENDLLDMA